MSHLMSSVNPAAAERLESAEVESLDVGTMVVYMARPGMQRMGRREFPAIVLGHDSEGFLDLFVMMEPEDMIMESHVRPFDGRAGADPTQVGHLWRRLDEEVPQDVAELQVQVAQLHEQNEALRSEIADIKKLILGDYKPARLSIYDLLKDFEDRLAAKT